MIRVVAGLLRDKDGRVLMAKRPEGKAFAKAWEFPGGKVEEGETDQEALKREWFEELGLIVTVGGFVHTVELPELDAEVAFYLVHATGQTYELKEHSEAMWVSSGILAALIRQGTLRSTPASRKLVKEGKLQ